MKHKYLLTCAAGALLAGSFMGLDAGFVSGAHAQSRRNTGRVEQSRISSKPVLAVVSLAHQRVTIYDANGKILTSPVSSGTTNLETPAGIFTVVQKEEEHHSNLYDDASMPFMERITWTGVALHAGVLPGVPASHGCVRMPLDFARQLYGLTDLGMRVVIVREDILPVSVPQPAMFTRKGGPETASNASSSQVLNVSVLPNGDKGLSASPSAFALQDLARTKAGEADAAKRKQKELRQVSTKKAAEAAAAIKAAKAAEAAAAKADTDLKAAERSLQEASSPAPAPASGAEPSPEAAAKIAQAKAQTLTKLETAKASAQTKLDAARAQVQTLTAAADQKTSVSQQADRDLQDAIGATAIAAEAAEKAKYDVSPVSVFVSRKTQRLYIRKGNYPIYETPVTISDPDKPIGTFIYTALANSGPSGEMSWNMVSMYKNATNIQPYAEWQKNQPKVRKGDALPADTEGAQAALTRLEISEEVAARISEIVLPGASLIISDEGLSRETGKDTDFVVIMSGEPQGGIAIRAKSPSQRVASSKRSSWFDDDEPRSSRRGGGFGGFGEYGGGRRGGFFSLFGD